MSSDYSVVKIVGISEETGYPIDSDGHLAQIPHANWKIGEMTRQLTSPYGALTYAIGNGDDFVCFEHAWIYKNDDDMELPTHIVLHATVNSETGSFIQGFDYQIIKLDHTLNVHSLEEVLGMIVLNYISRAEDWCCDCGPCITHSKSGWNQDQFYWYRYIMIQFKNIFNIMPEIGSKEMKKDFSDRELRFGGKRINNFLNIGFLNKK